MARKKKTSSKKKPSDAIKAASESKQDEVKEPVVEEAPPVVEETSANTELIVEEEPAGAVVIGEATEVPVEEVVDPVVVEEEPATQKKTHTKKKKTVSKVAGMLAEHKAMMSGNLSNNAIKAGAEKLAHIAIEVHNNPTSKNLDTYLDYLTSNPTIIGNIQYVMDNNIHNGFKQRASVAIMQSALLKIARCTRAKLAIQINMEPIKSDCIEKAVINYIASKI